MAKMVYLTKTIKEVLRYYPTVPWVARTLELSDLKLPDGRVIPRGRFCVHCRYFQLYLVISNETDRLDD